VSFPEITNPEITNLQITNGQRGVMLLEEIMG